MESEVVMAFGGDSRSFGVDRPPLAVISVVDGDGIAAAARQTDTGRSA
jgi:hypothetical protein